MSAGAIAGMRERDTLYLMLAGIFIASLVSCNLIFQKFFAWTPLAIVAETFPSLESALPWSGWRYKIELSVGILPYPVTFLCTDVISELYGKKNADRVVVSGLIASVFILGVVWLATATTAAEWSPVQNDTFSRVFGLAPWFVSASMIAYLTAQFIDIRIFHFFKLPT